MYCGYYYNYTCILLVMYLKFYKLDINIYCTLFLQFGAYLAIVNIPSAYKTFTWYNGFFFTWNICLPSTCILKVTIIYYWKIESTVCTIIVYIYIFIIYILYYVWTVLSKFFFFIKWKISTFTVYTMVNYEYVQNVKSIYIYMPKYICWPRYRVLILLSYIKLWCSQTHINYVYLPSYLLIHDKYMYIHTYYIHYVSPFPLSHS